MPPLAEKPQWMVEHEASDNKQFAEAAQRDKVMNEKLDSILEIVSAFKLGGRGVAWIIGFLVGIGTLIVLVMKIFRP